MLHQVVEQSIGQIAGALPEGTPVTVSVKFPEYEWFFRHRAVEVLANMGYPVSGNREDVNGGYYTIEIGIEKFGIRYTDIKRRSLFGARVMTRHADGEFSFRITGGTGERVVRVSESVSDVIPYGKRDEIENHALPFTRAELPGGSLTERYVGPAIIVAAAGMVVYLFFSVRS